MDCATYNPSCTQLFFSDSMCFFNKQFVGAWNFHMVIDTKVLCKHGPCSNCGVKYMQPSELKSYDIVLRDILFNMKPTTVTVHMDEFRTSHRKGCAKLIILDIQDSAKAGYTIRLKKALISSCITAPLSKPRYLSDIYDLKLETVRKLCADTRNAIKKRKIALRSSVIIRSYFSVAGTSGHTFFFAQRENTQQELVGIYTTKIHL